MLAYLDSSVVLRVVFGEPGQLAEFHEIDEGISSEILMLECLRTIDRLRLRVPLSDEEVVLRNQAVFEIAEHLHIVPVVPRVLQRASQPFPTLLGTLDAIHLASALAWQESEGKTLTVMTHDRELSMAARSLGMPVLGT
ncbi:MAG: type II toxin-antitoxin system VapC family toxin [Planctomycetota bacterium]